MQHSPHCHGTDALFSADEPILPFTPTAYGNSPLPPPHQLINYQSGEKCNKKIKSPVNMAATTFGHFHVHWFFLILCTLSQSSNIIHFFSKNYSWKNVLSSKTDPLPVNFVNPSATRSYDFPLVIMLPRGSWDWFISSSIIWLFLCSKNKIWLFLWEHLERYEKNSRSRQYVCHCRY